MHRAWAARTARATLAIMMTAGLTVVASGAPAPPAAADGNEAPGNSQAFRSISAGTNHTCALLPTGAVKCWGNNAIGQLGLGDIVTRGDGSNEMGDSLPAVDLGTSRTATAIVVGDVHTCALLDNGTVKCWGGNGSGQLGQGNTTTVGDGVVGSGAMGDSLPAVDLGVGRTATALSAGGDHTCAILDNGTVKCWGDNSDGALGLGDAVNRGDGAGEMGDNLPTVPLGAGRTATAIAVGEFHTCARLDNGAVKCWGANDSGQLGLGDDASRGDNPGEMGDNLAAVLLGTGRTAVAVSAGAGHTCALLDNATIKCWGAHGSGQLGIGDGTDKGDEPGEMGDNLTPVSVGSGRTATSVSAGGEHTCARLDNGSVKCWGKGSSGQLGLGDTADRGGDNADMGDNLPAVNLGTGRTAFAVTTGDNHTCAILDNQSLKCWGLNTLGQLGVGDAAARGGSPGQMGDSLPVVALLSRHVAAVASGSTHTCALLDNGTVKCWGGNAFGQLGLGNTTARGDGPGEMGDNLPAVSLGTGRTATAIAVGDLHSCALLDNATVKCWGDNEFGQLGVGDTADRGDGPAEMGDALTAVSLGTGRTATAISVGFGTTCARLDNGSVKCWGRNSSGQLGLGDGLNRGDAGGEMGNSLPTVSLGTGRTATSVSAGDDHTCARLDNGTVKCWGYGGEGRLGLGDTTNRGDASGEMGDSLPAVALGAGRTATAVVTGGAHTCAVLDDGSVRCWGFNASGQLGLGDTANRGAQPAQMGDALPVVNLGAGRTVVSMDAGGSHTCARLNGGVLKCWGANGSGQLGSSDSAARGDGGGEMGDSLNPVQFDLDRTATAVSAGVSHTCVRLDSGGVKCWGANGSGQLGLGDTANRGDAIFEMGPFLPLVDLGSAGLSGISGTVVDSVSASAVPNAFVIVMRTNDFSIVTGAVADGAGNYVAAVAPGSYFVYVIDRTGAHTAGFDGQPGATTVTVTADTMVDADPAMVPTRGRITGTIRETGPNTPIAGSWALALDNGGVPESGVVTNGSGQFALPGLKPANHFVAYIDPAGAHPTRFFPNSPDVPHATLVNATAGGTTVANGSLPTQAVTGTGAALTGTITEQGIGNTPLANIFVIALKAADFSIARGGITNGAGNYNLNVVPGTYKIVFLDSAGLHNAEWHNNQPATGLANATSVTAPAVTNAALDRSTGSISGTVIGEPSATPLAGAWVLAIGPTGVAGGAVTAANGTYTITGLPPGTYRAAFIDPTGRRTLEYHDNSPDFAGATPFNVSAGVTVNDLDASLALP